MFGPPDKIEFHTSSPATNYPVEQWLYHHIKDIGDNVLIDYADKSRTGEFKMTKDPNPKGARFIR